MFTGQVTGQGRVWRDPSGSGIWAVPDGFDPQSSPYNPQNVASLNQTTNAYSTALAPTPALNTVPGVTETATPFTDPAMNAPVFGTNQTTNPLAQSLGGGWGAPQQTQASSYSPTWQSPVATPAEATPMAPGLPPGVLNVSDAGNTPSQRSGFQATLNPLGNAITTQTLDDYRRSVNSGTPLTNRPVIEEYGNVNSNPSLGNQQATAPQLPADLVDALKQLMQNALDQGQRGQEAYTGITEDIRNFLNFNRDATTQSMGRQDELINSLLGRINPAIDQSLALMNQREGLSPEAMAALRGQAIEGSATQYGQNVEALKTELARRGAAGGGDLPGSAGDIARGYGPLMASRDAQRSQGLRDAILADEQRKFESFGLNRQTAMQGLNTAAGLTGTLGNVYDPSKFLSTSTNALGQLTDIVGNRNASATNALNQAGGLAQALLGNQSEQARLAEQARQANQSNTTANRAIDLETKNTSTAKLLKNAAIGTGLSWLDDLIFGDDNNGNNNDETTENFSGLSGALSGGAKQVAGAIKSGLGAAGAGLAAAGKAAAGLLTNPVTAAIGAGILTATLWLKSQAHHEANTWVQGFQNPFDSKVGALNDQFYQLAQSGQLKKAEANQIRDSIVGMIADYEAKRQSFEKKGSDERTVARQAKATADEWYGADFEPYIQKLDDVIKGLA